MEMAVEERSRQSGDLPHMHFESEVTGIEPVEISVRYIALVGSNPSAAGSERAIQFG
jgi:hypothetical protein